MKQNYSHPLLRITNFSPSDIITASGYIWNGPDYDQGGDRGQGGTDSDGFLDDSFWSDLIP